MNSTFADGQTCFLVSVHPSRPLVRPRCLQMSRTGAMRLANRYAVAATFSD